MKTLPSLLCGLALLTSAPAVFAATTPAAKPAAKTPAPAAPADDNLPQGAYTPATLKLDDYITAVATAVDLSDTEKKEIHDLYTADGAALQNILNDNTLSSLQKAQQVSDLRDVRNGKIVDILHNIDRQHAFLQVEAVYRVSLTELAANGGLTPPPATDAAASVPGASPTPVVEPAKSDAGAAMTSGASPSQPATTTPPPANAPVTTPPPAK